MITRKNGITVGDRIRLTEDLDMGHIIYHKGHEFKVIGSGERGLDIMDDDDNKVIECMFVQSTFELVSNG